MDSKLKCIICGTVAIAFFGAHNNPICDRCYENLKEAPHTVEVPYAESIGAGGFPLVTNITSSATVITGYIYSRQSPLNRQD